MTNKYYDCAICHGLNDASKVHCQFCGAVPSMYHIPVKLMTVAAQGVWRQDNGRTSKALLRTVPLDYYGEK